MARSLAEAEFKSMAATAAEMVWLKGLFGELRVKLTKLVKILCDSKAAIQIADNLIFHKRTKYIDIDCHFVRGKVKNKTVQTQHISTQEQLADMLTKGLGKAQHYHLLSKLSVKNIFLPKS